MEQTVVKKYDMKINIKKTKVMKLGRQPSIIKITVGREILQQVEEFKYLGSILSSSWYSEKDIRVRIGMAKSAYNKLKKLLIGGLKLEVKKILVKTLVWSVAMYGSETWTIKKVDATRQAFEMWVWRRLVKVKWTDKKTNAEVLNLVKEKKSLLSEMRKRKRKWIGHILRHENMLHTVLEGRMKRKHPRWKKIIELVDDVMNGTYAQMKRRAEDREEWRRNVMRDLP